MEGSVGMFPESSTATPQLEQKRCPAGIGVSQLGQPFGGCCAIHFLLEQDMMI
jgi:hypothetical protein